MEKVPLLICDQSDQGYVRKSCKGAWMGFSVHHHFFAWQRDLTTKAIKSRKTSQRWERCTFFIAGLIVFFGVLHYAIAAFFQWFPAFNITKFNTTWVWLTHPFLAWWLLVWLLMYIISRIIDKKIKDEFVILDAAQFEYDDNVDWKSVSKLHKRSFHNIANAWAPRAIEAFEKTALLSHERDVQFSLFTLFETLLQTPDVQSILIRLELPPTQIQTLFHQQFLAKEPDHAGANGAMWQVIAQSYIDAARNKDPKVTVFHLFDACFVVEPMFADFLEQHGVLPDTLKNALAWFKFMNHLSAEVRTFRKRAVMRSTDDTGAAMTGMATPLLNAIGEDLTKAAQFGYLQPTIGRENEMNTALRAFQSGAQGIVLTGQQGVGKMSVVSGLAEKMVSEDVPEQLKDKRLIRVPITHIVSGSNTADYHNRLMQVIIEAVNAGNVVLAFEGIEGLFGIQVGKATSQDLSDTLAEMLEQTRLTAIATASDDAFARVINNSRFASLVTKVEVQPVDENTAIQILEAQSFITESRHRVFFTYKAIEQCVIMAQRFLQDDVLPANALKLMKEVAAYVHNKKGSNQLVRDEDVGYVISEKTHVPTTSVNQNEREKLLHLETQMHERVIGQTEAVQAVASALRRARTDISGGKRPIASFLFLGPTGVGKTETAKALVSTYFGGEDRMLRFDMSEYQDAQAIYRLIGQPGVQGSGMMTQAVRNNPFSLILLDEFEKADAGILNMFLQVMDDGRLTDSTGKVVDFTNSMIIATSNAGAQYIQDAVKVGESGEIIKQTLLDRELQTYFRPELINRFDGAIVFTPLNQEEIEEIAHLMIHTIAQRLYTQKGIKLDVADTYISRLSQKGYSPEFGARPMRRVIQSDIEDVIASALLEGSVSRGQTIHIDDNGKVSIL